MQHYSLELSEFSVFIKFTTYVRDYENNMSAVTTSLRGGCIKVY